MAGVPDFKSLKRLVHLKVGDEIVFVPVVVLLEAESKSTKLYEAYIQIELEKFLSTGSEVETESDESSVGKITTLTIELPVENGSAREIQQIVNYLTVGPAGVAFGGPELTTVKDRECLRKCCSVYGVMGLLKLLEEFESWELSNDPSTEEAEIIEKKEKPTKSFSLFKKKKSESETEDTEATATIETENPDVQNEVTRNIVTISASDIHVNTMPSQQQHPPTESLKRSLEERRKVLEMKAEEIRRELKALELELDMENQIKNNLVDAEDENVTNMKFNARRRDKLEVELQSILYIRDQTILAERHEGKSLAYNLLVVGVTGTGKSSSLNTLLDNQLCKVSGGQAQGTRGCNMQDGSISGDHFVSFIDTQGLGADTTVTDQQLLQQIMMSTESVNKMGIINNVLISFDLANRQTPAVMANQLTLMELFTELRRSSFLIFTKWNTNSVQSEWNTPLKKWVRKWRRTRRIEDIKEDPPSYHEMYQAYCNYIVSSMVNDEDGGSFSKMGTFLLFFEARVLWMYNLDGIQIEDKEYGDLEPHIEKLYNFYRNLALETLHRGRGQHHVEDLTFLKKSEDTLGTVAQALVSERDRKIDYLESIGKTSVSLSKMEAVFKDMAAENVKNMKNKCLENGSKPYMDEIAVIAGLKHDQSKSPIVGCVVS
eukprot:CAMPEP_0204823766 /NCGR_PEP_ID=MMETSP1346-20131115/1844_1 /ASSEMBLY_ACC=CAM_ASM_000771 /TAXON_ID=215587 /ORGANISM="Aplanochytrium stocchinoi, Strain GSBS06" /LENGTH=658 /DNA_ID=CAMNT_0051950555 /DNA_START=178 /DNA_END=2155 /DNA_ORIENTATION=+